MMNILFIDDNPEIRDLLIFSLMSHTEFRYREANSKLEAVELLAKETFDYVISDLNMPNGGGIDMINHIRQSKIQSRIAVIGNEPLSSIPAIANDPMVLYIQKPFVFEDLQVLIAHLTDRNISQSPRDYIPVTLNFLRRIREIPIPIYVRINEAKFVKLTAGPMTFGDAEHQRYAHRGLTELYVETLMADTLVGQFSRRAFSRDAWQEASVANHDHIHINADAVRSICHSMNWSEEKVQEILRSAETALHIIRMQPQLAKVFHQFQKIEKWGLSDHAAMLLTMTAGLAEVLGHGNADTLQKLTFVALLHDMSLTDRQYENKPKLIERALLREFDAPKDVKDVWDHPALAAEACKKLAVCPPEVEQIIFAHHERPDGKGFPMGKKAEELSFLASLVIFSEDFTETFIEHGGRIDYDGFAKSRSRIYQTGHFRFILETFQKCSQAPAPQIAS